MSTGQWVLIGIGVGIVWITVAVLVALVVGRVIRNRDQQVPRTPRKQPQGWPLDGHH